MRSIWNPSFLIAGLEIPVQLIPAVTKSKISFETVDSRDMTKIKFVNTNELTNQPVPLQYIGKAYNHNGFIHFISRELYDSCLPPVSNQVIFDYFIQASDLPFAHVDSFYNVLPQFGEELNYSYVLKMLNDLDVMGIGQATFMNCSNVFALHHKDNYLVVYKLRFCEQLLAPDPVALPSLPPDDDAVMLALKGFVLDNLLPFDLSGFKDTFNENFLEKISDTLDITKSG